MSMRFEAVGMGTEGDGWWGEWSTRSRAVMSKRDCPCTSGQSGDGDGDGDGDGEKRDDAEDLSFHER